MRGRRSLLIVLQKAWVQHQRNMGNKLSHRGKQKPPPPPPPPRNPRSPNETTRSPNETIPMGCRDAQCYAARDQYLWRRYCWNNGNPAGSNIDILCDKTALLAEYLERNQTQDLWGCDSNIGLPSLPPMGRYEDFCTTKDNISGRYRERPYGTPGENLRWKKRFSGPLVRALVVVVGELWASDSAAGFAALASQMCSLHHNHPTADFFVALTSGGQGAAAGAGAGFGGRNASSSSPAASLSPDMSPYLDRVRAMAGDFNSHQGLLDFGTNLHQEEFAYSTRGRMLVEAVPPPPGEVGRHGYPFVQSVEAALKQTAGQSYSHVVAIPADAPAIHYPFPLFDLDCPMSYFDRGGFVASHWAAVEVTKEAASLDSSAGHQSMDVIKAVARRALGVDESTCRVDRLPLAFSPRVMDRQFNKFIQELLNKPSCAKQISLAHESKPKIENRSGEAAALCEAEPLGYEKWQVDRSLCSVFRKNEKKWWYSNRFAPKRRAKSDGLSMCELDSKVWGVHMGMQGRIDAVGKVWTVQGTPEKIESEDEQRQAATKTEALRQQVEALRKEKEKREERRTRTMRARA